MKNVVGIKNKLKVERQVCRSMLEYAGRVRRKVRVSFNSI